LAATMSQKSSVPQAAKFVSQTLKRDTGSAASQLLGLGSGWDAGIRIRPPRIAALTICFD
jgi:hypothetical protein